MPADQASTPERERGEEGFSAVELIVVTGLLGVVLAIVLTVLVSFQNTASRVDLRSRTDDQVRTAVAQIDRLVRSGNVLYDPATEGSNAGPGVAAGFSMRIYTQANGQERCVQWRVTNGSLQSRSWSQTWQVDSQVSGWRTVSDHIVNTSSSPPFSLDANAGFGSRLIKINILANVQSKSGSDVQGTSSVTGRNTQYGYDPVVCNAIPTP